jgi:hypothetical protein
MQPATILDEFQIDSVQGDRFFTSFSNELVILLLKKECYSFDIWHTRPGHDRGRKRWTMWVKLGNEYLNLDHVVRVKFNKGWKNGQEELVAEVEAMVKGEVQTFTRYRGAESAMLLAILQPQFVPEPVTVGAPASAPVAAPLPGSHAMSNTLHDLKLP